MDIETYIKLKLRINYCHSETFFFFLISVIKGNLAVTKKGMQISKIPTKHNWQVIELVCILLKLHFPHIQKSISNNCTGGIYIQIFSPDFS
jgi:hypothetical protein